MENISIKVNDILTIAGVQYEVKYIESCNDCCLCNTRQCSMLDPAISCGEKTHLGFKVKGFNINKLFNQLTENQKKYKNINKNNKLICKV